MVKVREDLTGKTFGRLTVVKQAKDYISPNGERQAQWLCECSCKKNNYVVVRGMSLKNGDTQSCGCLQREKAGSNFVDMTGWKMWEHGVPNSRLTVIERVPSDKKWAVMWLCECNCKEHNKIIVSAAHLKDGHTLSCGCYRTERLVEYNSIDNECGFCDDGDGKWLLLNNTNRKTFYDLDDADKIEQYTWYEDNKGYATASIDKKHIKIHQLIGFTGYDHEDRNPLNNRKSNLRPCTYQENSRNRSLYKNNKTGITGVNWSTAKNKWRATIGVNYKTIHIGYFDDFDAAIKARLQAEAVYFKEFAPQRCLFKQYKINESMVM